uniref:ATG16 domain-containing protein n=3 Tax=Macrostomum lignano TaxID=282301 RepID=A0A1I8ITB0_9PLAT
RRLAWTEARLLDAEARAAAAAEESDSMHARFTELAAAEAELRNELANLRPLLEASGLEAIRLQEENAKLIAELEEFRERTSKYWSEGRRGVINSEVLRLQSELDEALGQLSRERADRAQLMSLAEEENARLLAQLEQLESARSAAAAPPPAPTPPPPPPPQPQPSKPSVRTACTQTFAGSEWIVKVSSSTMTCPELRRLQLDETCLHSAVQTER